MKLLIQRVRETTIRIGEEEVARSAHGICAFVGITHEDSERDAVYLAQKLLTLRIFPDEKGRFARSILDTRGQIMIVSAFTLYGDCRDGRRPSLSGAAPPGQAKRLYEHFVARVMESGLEVSTGRFQASMQVAMVNDGPVTFLLESGPG